MEKDTKQNQHREKVHGAKSGEYHLQASKNPLPVVSHRTCLIPPVTNCNNTCEVLSTKESNQRLSPQGFYQGLVTYTSSGQHILEFQTPQRTAGVQQKPHCLHSLGTVSLLYQYRESGSTLAIQVPICQPCRPTFLRRAVSGLGYYSFLHSILVFLFVFS